MAAELSRMLPEFHDPYDETEIEKRFCGKAQLILIAYSGKTPVGFKVGYERDGYFYSWLGGVLPNYRGHGVAKKLADAQELWAKEKGYDSVTFKTRNRHKAMLCFALKMGLTLLGLKRKEKPGNTVSGLKKNYDKITSQTFSAFPTSPPSSKTQLAPA